MIPGRKRETDGTEREVFLDLSGVTLEGALALPKDARGIVLFAHGSGSSRRSPRNRYVAEVLNSRRIATLLFDLLTREEEVVDAQTAELRFDIPLLAKRLQAATLSILRDPGTMLLPVGYFGASTGAAAALLAAARGIDVVAAVVSRGGRGARLGEGPHAAHRRRRGRRGDRDEPPGPCRTGLPGQKTCHRPRGNPLVRGAGETGRGGAACHRLVRSIPRSR
jgi:dienelactone hydrolase